MRGLRYGVAGMALGVDLAAKAWARLALAGRGRVWVWRPVFSLQLLYNRGAMLGVGAGHERLIGVLALLAVAALGALVWRVQRGGTGLALMLGGGAGNLISRIAQGRVTDFLRLSFWPGIFNLADVFIRVGALLVVLALLLTRAP